jgi:predicted ATPase
MIESISLKNFKCFADNVFSLSNLTVFAGSNASGKSSVIQAILLLRQSYESGYLYEKRMQLNGRLYSIGTVRDMVKAGSGDRNVSITLIEDGVQRNFYFEYGSGELDGYKMKLKNEFSENDIRFLLNDFSYLCAERLGPRNLYDIPQIMLSKKDMGIHGEYVASVLEDIGDQPAVNQKLSKNAPNLHNAVKFWLNTILPNIDIKYRRITEADSISMQFNDTDVFNHQIRPVNTGFGISYTLPVIVAALSLSENSVLIVENPESHLHPFAQSMMGKFLAQAAGSGVQVIIETHSDHIINGIRLAVKGNPELSEMTIINSLKYFQKERENVEIRIDRDGNLDKSPDGFFDQIEKDLMELF